MRVVPVRFSHFKPSLSVIAPLSQADVDLGLANLNAKFADAGLTFVQCGKITIVEDDRFALNADYDNFLSPFSYTSGALEMVISQGGFISLAPIPPPAYLQGNTNSNAGFPWVHDNFVQLLGTVIPSTSTAVHEVGHHFGLLHTFMPTRPYVNPVLPGQLDHPEIVLNNPNDPNSGPHPSWWARELVIRENDASGTKTFPIQNSDFSGDFIGDTPADCLPGSSFYPGCSNFAQNISTCEINTALLTYKDYNNDPIFPPPSGMTIGNNYMSYWDANCLNSFTPGQNANIKFFYDTYRKGQYFSNCNFNEEVEFWDTNLGLKKVNVRIRYDTLIKHKCNTFSQSDGSFSGVLHNNKIKSYITQNGLGTQKLYENTAPRMHYKATQCEWSAGVNMDDVYLITQHLLGVEPLLNGYAKIAADVSNNGIISNFDNYLIRRILLGYSVSFPAFDNPWRFIPEFVPQIFSAGFDANPFNMEINGLVNVSAPKLCEGEYLFNMPSIEGQRGFDGVKLGDVNGDWPAFQCTPPMEPPQSPGGDDPVVVVPGIGVDGGKDITLTVSSKDFKSVTAFQLALQIPSSHFEYVSSTGGKASFMGYEDDFFAYDSSVGVFKTVWFDPKVQPSDVSDGAEVFKINLKTKQAVANLASVVTLDGSSFKNTVWKSGPVSAMDAAVSFIVTVSETVTDREEVENDAKKEVNSTTLTAYPNPVKSCINLLIENRVNAAQGNIVVRDINGKVIYSNAHSIVEGMNELSLSGTESLPQGNYFIEVQLGAETLRTKIVKQ